jgi:monoterpene epsilon-lactone hydrolase
MVVSGESAGGNLAVELLVAGKADGLTKPAAALLLSPMTDLTATGSSYDADATARCRPGAAPTRGRQVPGPRGTAVTPPVPR